MEGACEQLAGTDTRRGWQGQTRGGWRLEAPVPAAPVANVALALWRTEDVSPVANISDKTTSSSKGY